MLYLKNQQMAIDLSGIVVVCANGKTQLKIQMNEFLKVKMTEFSVGNMLVIAVSVRERLMFTDCFFL